MEGSEDRSTPRMIAHPAPMWASQELLTAPAIWIRIWRFPSFISG